MRYNDIYKSQGDRSYISIDKSKDNLNSVQP